MHTLHDVSWCANPFSGKIILFRGGFRYDMFFPSWIVVQKAHIADATLLR
jgi:hypothetical protein